MERGKNLEFGHENRPSRNHLHKHCHLKFSIYLCHAGRHPSDRLHTHHYLHFCMCLWRFWRHSSDRLYTHSHLTILVHLFISLRQNMYSEKCKLKINLLPTKKRSSFNWYYIIYIYYIIKFVQKSKDTKK